MSYHAILYRDTEDIYGNYDGYIDYFMARFGLTDSYDTRFLLSNENPEIIQYPLPDLLDKKDAYIFLNKEVKIVSRQPSSLVDAISKLGGILAIINIRFIIAYVN